MFSFNSKLIVAELKALRDDRGKGKKHLLFGVRGSVGFDKLFLKFGVRNEYGKLWYVEIEAGQLGLTYAKEHIKTCPFCTSMVPLRYF